MYRTVKAGIAGAVETGDGLRNASLDHAFRHRAAEQDKAGAGARNLAEAVACLIWPGLTGVEDLRNIVAEGFGQQRMRGKAAKGRLAGRAAGRNAAR